MQRDGLGGAAGGAVGLGEVVAAGERVGVVGAELRLVKLERRLVQIDLPGDAEQQQLTPEPRGWQRAIPSPPFTAQPFRIHLRYHRQLGVELG